MIVTSARLIRGDIKHNLRLGTNRMFLAEVATSSGERLVAVTKQLSPEQLINELVSASLVGSLDFAAPRPFLIYSDPQQSIDCENFAHDGKFQLYFGREFSVHKSLIAFFDYKCPIVLDRIRDSHDWGLILAIDELLANVDRHFGNFLFDGSTMYLIDHDRCFGGPDRRAEALIADKMYPCHQDVSAVYSVMTPKDKEHAQVLIKYLALTVSKFDLSRIVNDSLAREVKNMSKVYIDEIEGFLKERLHVLPMLCQKRLYIANQREFVSPICSAGVLA